MVGLHVQRIIALPSSNDSQHSLTIPRYVQDLDEAARKFLAWRSILDEKETLNLDPHQVRQAETQRQAADGAVTARLPETYQWLLVPEQATPQAPIRWQAIRLSGGDALAPRASRRLRSDELLVTSLGSTILRKHLDEVPLWRCEHVPVQQLVQDFARYLYLPRLSNPEVLLRAIHDGEALITWQSDGFAYAESRDEAVGRYRGLRGGKVVHPSADDPGLIVKADVAWRQLEAETAPTQSDTAGPVPPSTTGPGPVTPAPPPERVLSSYHGTVALDPARVGRDASRIADEVISHLAGLVGATVRVTLEIESEIPDGAPDHVARTITENGRTLKFTSQGFEDS